jgi:hypothetical protein
LAIIEAQFFATQKTPVYHSRSRECLKPVSGLFVISGENKSKSVNCLIHKAYWKERVISLAFQQRCVVEWCNHFIVIVHHAQMVGKIIRPTSFHIGYALHVEACEDILEANFPVVYFLSEG